MGLRLHGMSQMFWTVRMRDRSRECSIGPEVASSPWDLAAATSDPGPNCWSDDGDCVIADASALYEDRPPSPSNTARPNGLRKRLSVFAPPTNQRWKRILARRHYCSTSSVFGDITPVSAMLLEEAQKDKEAAALRRREVIKLSRHPRRTLKLFWAAIWSALRNDLALRAHTHRYVISYGLLAFLTTGFFCHNSQSWLGVLWSNTLTSVELIVWWVGLGALSSIGLGSGIHTGVLFLFPHIYQVTQTSEVCNSLDFEARNNMWGFRLAPGDTFPCKTTNTEADFDVHVSFFRLLSKVWIYAFFWGLGTALGELPPYAASYAAAKVRLRNRSVSMIPEPEGRRRRSQ
eukprot:Gregarina_sp_Poly_1__564@NODE_1135_length_4981_cov_83_856532_g784_i0_p3_GENE_NODE_1135_length_4981_cov_83_856532_g784_i0NODE_1135_length_4981_cov_83_856532_g784_i0_p3_ORF_typecomplete_len346_score25_84PerC/PF06069_11/13PerC/PF06069_11/29_NODE_1135_length_4981_cov_83_856532_g784_i039094946